MSELVRPIADFLEKNQTEVTDGQRRTMLEIVKRNLIYMSEAEMKQARYLLKNDRRKPT